ncbi:hypothetical protein F6X40_09960 [Paraburkholderia sp. UCT31]|uniref:hypothetical protein n=1 Tax=Paraburkholderia sp. UCT31 TaxID=2615209 RepID=UPI001654CCBD|nr:hypothetical protein [Paraburkholderia sp. UCT31]MBC8737131.1 hypothetical protein [Paraburkholderia sp. UCT31]
MDTEYCINGAAEMGEITPLEAEAALTLQSAYQSIRQKVDGDECMPAGYLENVARAALRKAPRLVQYWTALNAYRHGDFAMRLIAERAEYLVQKRIQKALGVGDEDSRIPGLGDPQPSTQPIAVVSEADVTEVVVRQVLNQEMGGLMARLREDVDLLEEAALWFRKDAGKAYRELDTALKLDRPRWGRTHPARATDGQPMRGRPTEDAGITMEEALQLVRANRRIESMKQKKARGAIKKVTKLFKIFGQEENLRMFVSGQEVEMSHPDSKLKLVVRPLSEPGWLERRSVPGMSHTPFNLSVLTKDNVHVTNLCVYVSDSPVLDQVLALSMFVHNGDELEILEKANWFGINYDAERAVVDAYPSLAKKMKRFDSIAREDGTFRVVLPRAFLEAENHWEPFKGRAEAWIRSWMLPVTERLLPIQAAIALPA